MSVPLSKVANFWQRAPYLVCLLVPINALVFLLTGPHLWYEALFYVVPPMIFANLDSVFTLSQESWGKVRSGWFFDAILAAIVMLHLAILAALCGLFSSQNLFSMDTVVSYLVVGQSSSLTIVAAHELIHRRSRSARAVGRLLLISVLYEYFYTEHLRGHHVNVGKAEDGATARFGESFDSFFKRGVPQQFNSAWSIEARRIKTSARRNPLMKLWGNRVFQGLMAELSLLITILVNFGYVAVLVFVLQAFSAIRSLEKVNYKEHWGLQRIKRRVTVDVSWDTQSWSSYYGLLGLAMHAHHHISPSTKYPDLLPSASAPVTPSGYFSLGNKEYQKAAAIELGRRGLGPFLGEGPVDKQTALDRLREAQKSNSESSFIRDIPAPVKWTFVVLVTAFGVQLETGASSANYPAVLLTHAWIYGSIVLSAYLAKIVISKEFRIVRPIVRYISIAILASVYYGVIQSSLPTIN